MIQVRKRLDDCCAPLSDRYYDDSGAGERLRQAYVAIIDVAIGHHCE
ncbi:ATPase component [Pseudomonas syringae pv. actinidiae]|uniref:ATPase component n=1 Tax=Pseudomonas syringae pv. actinidiae TaxID=103796 RepID=A0A2V0QHG4_PSESF|nr:ATPase component [Pseudomonas syringae pv. actinidiae]